MDNLESIFRRIKKLLAIAEDSRADANEAAAAASQAAKIMAKYQIDMSDVIMKELDEGRTDSFKTYDVGSTSDPLARAVWKHDQYLSILAVALAKLNEVQALFTRQPIFGKMIRFQGYKPDIEVVRFSWLYITHAIERSRKEHVGLDKAMDFRMGFSLAVVDNLQKALEEKQSEGRINSGGTALVVRKMSAVDAMYGENSYSNSPINVNDRDAFGKGEREGQKLNATIRGVGHTAVPQPRSLR